MTEIDLEPTDEFMARVMEGRAIAETGDLATAEEHFRGLLVEARTSHAGNHTRALSSLITLYGRAGRLFEVHVLARHLAAKARAAGIPALPTLAFAQSAICGVLSQLRLPDALEQALDEFHTTLQCSESPTPDLWLKYHAAAGIHAREAGDPYGARQHLDSYRGFVAKFPDMEPLFRWALDMSEAQLALLEEQPELALQLLPGEREGPPPPPHHRLKELTLAVCIHAAMRQTDEAVRIAREAEAKLGSVQDEPFLASDRIHQGTRLGRELERLGALDAAQRVYDLVAAALIVRLQQLDECVSQLPELGTETAADADALAAFRKQFLGEQRELLRRVAALWESRGAEQIQSLLKRSPDDDHIVICAWCESVRPGAGRWLPIGHFVPRDAQLRLTHSMCPTCAERWVDAG